MNISSKLLNTKLSKPNSQSRILAPNNSKINHSQTNSELLNSSKLSFPTRRIDHAKSSSILLAVPSTQSFIRERDVDKFSLGEDYYQFICLKVTELMKGFKIYLNCQGKDISKIRIDSDTIQVEKNQIRHTFDVPRSQEAKWVKLVLSSLTDNKMKINFQSILAKFKASTILVNHIDDECVDLDPYKLIEEAEELRKRKFNESTSRSIVKPRASLKIGDSRKLLFNNLKPQLEQSRFEKLSASQTSFLVSKDSQKPTNTHKSEHEKLKQTLNFKKQLEKKTQQYRKPFQHKATKTVTSKTQLNISTSSINVQPTILEYLSAKNLTKPNNQYLFKRKAKPSTYGQLALSKMVVATSRIE